MGVSGRNRIPLVIDQLLQFRLKRFKVKGRKGETEPDYVTCTGGQYSLRYVKQVPLPFVPGFFET